MSGLASDIVPPLMTAGLAAFGFWWRQRQDRHDRDKERRRVLLQVREEIDVLDAWVKAYDLVSPSESREQVHAQARDDLDRAYLRLSESL
jgi:hypothetical protein